MNEKLPLNFQLLVNVCMKYVIMTASLISQNLNQLIAYCQKVDFQEITNILVIIALHILSFLCLRNTMPTKQM